MSEAPVGPIVHTEGTAPGEQLRNYVNKDVSEDGTYVKITSHSERIEVIPQPLTPEEITEQKKSERLALGIAGGLGVLFFGFIGWMAYLDDKHSRRRDEALTEELSPPPA